MEKYPSMEALACALANSWLHARRDPKVINNMPPDFTQQLDKLDKLDKMTRGNPLRCFCVTGRDSNKRDHAMQCPAWKP